MDYWKRVRDDPCRASQRRAWDYVASLGFDVALGGPCTGSLRTCAASMSPSDSTVSHLPDSRRLSPAFIPRGPIRVQNVLEAS